MSKWKSVISVDTEFDTVRYSRALAIAIGEAEANFICQLEYLISISSAPEHEGRQWTYQSITDLNRKLFPFWSRSKVRRIKKKLVQADYIIQGNFNRLHYTDQDGNSRRDQTNWYALNLEKINEIPWLFTTNLRVEKPNYVQNEQG